MTTPYEEWTCSRCRCTQQERQIEERYDRYNIYAGRMCSACYNDSGLASWTFDPGYAGERLEEDDY